MLTLPPRGTIIVAISGGSDSTALLLKARQTAGSARLVAVTADHRLRPESADEAAAVARLCASLKIEHRTAIWEGDKPASGIAAAARHARHRLLADIAASLGTDIVLTGHTLDDQAETIAMRAARGDGLGLAGIAPATLFEGRTWFLRPLLGERREELRDFLRGQGIGWIDDPSNADPRNERARVRAGMTGTQHLLDQGRRAAETRRCAMAEAARLVDRHASMAAPGLFAVGTDLLRTDSSDARTLVLRLLLAFAGGTGHLPPVPRIEELIEGLAAGDMRANLSRAMIERRRNMLCLWRENRALPRLFLKQAEMLWDRRWHIRAKGELPDDLVIAPMASVRRPPEDGLSRRALAGAYAAEPGIWLGNRLVGPLRGRASEFGLEASPAIGPYAEFLPSFDLPAARSLARLVGAIEPPASPLAGHIDAEA